jgi:putative membrane protein
VLLFVVFASVSALAQQQGNGNYRGSWDHPHMWDGWGGGMFIGSLMMILVIAVCIAVVVLLVRWLSSGSQSLSASPPPGGKPPLDILNERFARGEIDKDEFEERKRLLSE